MSQPAPPTQRRLSASTRSAYASDWRHWAAWCREQHEGPTPVSPERVSAYLVHLLAVTDEAGNPRYRAATITRRVAALASYARQTDGEADLARHPLVAPLLAEARQRRASATPTTPLPAPDLASAVAAMSHHTWPEGVLAARDTLALLLAAAAHLGRTSVASLTVGDLTPATSTVALDSASDPLTCAACALARWSRLLVAPDRPAAMCHVLTTGSPHAWEHICAGAASALDGQDASAPLLRAVDVAGTISQRPLTPGSLNRILKRRLHEAGVDPTGYGFGSLRSSPARPTP